MPSWAEVYYLSEWAVRLVMLVVVMRRRRPSSAMAWLLVITFLPWVGLVLYLLIGTNRLSRRRQGLHARRLRELEGDGAKAERHASVTRPKLAPELNSAVTLATRLGDMPIVGGNDVELIVDTPAMVDRLVADIEAAANHVHLLFYIYGDDETGGRVADALARAAGRGVKCRVLVDASGSRVMLKRLAPEMRKLGIEVQAALTVSPFRRTFARIDMRNHRKLAVVDGRIAYTGSQNLIGESYGRKDLLWHDLMVRLTGPLVLELQTVFLSDWYFETEEKLKADDVFPSPVVTGDVAAQVLPSGPNYPTENYQRMVVASLHSAQQRAIITTPYFVPDEPLLEAMEIAVLRGVDVCLVVPMRSNLLLVGAASRAYYEELLQAGVKLYRFTDGLLHAKTMSIDDSIAFIGSSNFDIRSFALNFEINLMLYGPKATAAVRAQQEDYIRRSRQLTLKQWNQRPMSRRIFPSVAKLLSPLL